MNIQKINITRVLLNILGPVSLPYTPSHATPVGRTVGRESQRPAPKIYLAKWSAWICFAKRLVKTAKQ